MNCSRHLKVFWFVALAAALLFTEEKPRRVSLPSTKFLTTPVPGWLGSVNSFPATITLSPDGKYAALLNDGYGTQRARGHQSISILDLKTNELVDFPEKRLPEDAHQTYFLGLAFSSDGSRLYASMASITDPTGKDSGNTGNGIAVYSFRNGKVVPERFIKIPPQVLPKEKRVPPALRKTPRGTAIPYPAGLTVIAQAGKPDRLLVANNLSDNVVLLDATNGAVLKAIDLSIRQTVPTSFPYTVVASRDGRRAWCSLWNDSRVAELDLEKGTVVRSTPLLEPKQKNTPGSHPTALLLSKDEKLLYVALSNADRVAVVSTVEGNSVRLFDTSGPGTKFGGSYPNALAISADSSRLFVADAAINATAVFDVSGGMAADRELAPKTALGFIPSDWYPSALAVAGNDLLIASAKGQGSGPNNFSGGTDSERRSRERAYIPTLLYGSVARLSISEIEKKLPEFTQRVQQDNLFPGDSGEFKFARGSNPIRHVIYILKENRTYDQILGDLKVGNGDPSLTMYGWDVTPNEHKLALQFGVLDNFYDSGEVSGDGHEWSTAAITSDYNEKTWQITYRSKEHLYDYQGSVSEQLPLELGVPDVDAPATGYIWDNLADHNLSYRIYGEFITATWCTSLRKGAISPKEGTPSGESSTCDRAVVNKGEPLPSHLGNPHGSPSPWPWPVPILKQMRANKAVLRDHFDPLFPDFNTEYPDQLRADQFLNEFDKFVLARKQGKGEQLPSFILLYLPDDHTHGTAPGKPRPAASVADNDLALGRVVEAVSHSPYWDDTAIFVIEDDAQDGADHVDAHRSIAFAISKYSPGSSTQPLVDSRFYTTVNMIRTMEALLGLPPMNHNDAHAPLMSALFTGEGTQPPYVADWKNRDNELIYQVNPPKGPGAKASAEMNFSRPDAVNTALLNRILWRERMGRTPMPAPRHSVFPAGSKTDDDD